MRVRTLILVAFVLVIVFVVGAAQLNRIAVGNAPALNTVELPRFGGQVAAR